MESLLNLAQVALRPKGLVQIRTQRTHPISDLNFPISIDPAPTVPQFISYRRVIIHNSCEIVFILIIVIIIVIVIIVLFIAYSLHDWLGERLNV